MTDKNKSNQSDRKSVFEKNSRALPTTATKTPMPQVKPPKPPEPPKKS